MTSKIIHHLINTTNMRENTLLLAAIEYMVIQLSGYPISKETFTKMFTLFLIGFNYQYGPYAHFGYWTLVSDP